MTEQAGLLGVICALISLRVLGKQLQNRKTGPKGQWEERGNKKFCIVSPEFCILQNSNLFCADLRSGFQRDHRVVWDCGGSVVWRLKCEQFLQTIDGLGLYFSWNDAKLPD
jgi:hypothetical protein